MMETIDLGWITVVHGILNDRTLIILLRSSDLKDFKEIMLPEYVYCDCQKMYDNITKYWCGNCDKGLTAIPFSEIL